MGVCLKNAGVPPARCGSPPAACTAPTRCTSSAPPIWRAALAGASIEGVGKVERITGTEAAHFYKKLFGRTGMIYIQDYWKRHGETTCRPATTSMCGTATAPPPSG